MKIKIDNYIFDKTARTITFSDYVDISLARVVMVVNVENNEVVYNFAGSGKGGSVSGNVLTLDYDTSAMANTDRLQIIYDDKDASLLAQLLESIKLMFRVMANPPWVDKTANQMRAQVTGSITTVTTVTTAASVTNFGTYPAQQGIIDQNRAAWAALVRGRLT